VVVTAERSLLEVVQAAPIAAITAAGFGRPGPAATSVTAAALQRFVGSADGVRLALETCGVMGVRLVSVLLALGGRAGAAELARQTAHADPAALAATVERLAAAGIVVAATDGSLSCPPAVLRVLRPVTRSLGDPDAALSDQLAVICRTLGIATPSRKAERVEAIRATFADPHRRAELRDELSPGARLLLHELVDLAGCEPAAPDALDLSVWELATAAIDRLLRPVHRHGSPRAEALHELVRHGIVGVDPYERELWVWAEAWPLLERPFILDWGSASRPPIEAISHHGEPAVPACVGVFERLLARWAEQPPAMLRSGQARLGKPEVRSLAKAVAADEATVDVLARLAISLQLALVHETGRSGRGRAQRIDHVWAIDTEVQQAWNGRAPLQRWVRLVAEWCAPALDAEAVVVAVRHLLLWELQQLPPSEAYAGDEAFVAFFADRHAPLATVEIARGVLADLRALGVIGQGPVALTALGRAALGDPATAVQAVAAEADRAFVQADLTVIAPPDLRHDLVLALERIAVIESTGGATIHRLDAGRITRAVQLGDTAEGIVAVLAELAGGPLPDTVTRLVHDAAAAAGSVQLAAARTVLVVDDPAQLTVACAIKSLQLTRLAPNVAVTDVALAKVQAALLAKGIAPKVTGVATTKPAPSSAAMAALAEREAARLRSAQLDRNPYVERHASQLEAHAAQLRDLDGRFAVPAALTLTPEAAAALAGVAGRTPQERHDG